MTFYSEPAWPTEVVSVIPTALTQCHVFILSLSLSLWTSVQSSHKMTTQQNVSSLNNLPVDSQGSFKVYKAFLSIFELWIY